ncbi:unnamed protein product [Wuchereria bancrofti]|uniref:DNA polymerase delta subunit 3 n=1 Tax=Wuchereria bancrofti TaxID=6293 RepID=A0A3P7DUQ3_WUCBA|nr:unnamed protein product [Wuchereria bancrofti]
MGLDRRQLLETSLFDLEQIVTVQYLSRHADLPVDDAKDELTEFLKQNKNRTELHSVYVISGELIVPDPASGYTASDIAATRKIHRTQLVRDCDLEVTRQVYRKVETCEIYCLHTKPIKSLCLLYSVDSLEDDEYERTDPGRSWLSYPEAETKAKDMLAHYDAISVPATQKKRKQKLSISKLPEPMAKKTKDNINSLFQQAAKQNNQERTEQGDFAKKANIVSGEAIKHRGQRIFINSKEEDMKEESKSSKVTGIKNVVTKSGEITTSKKNDVDVETRNTFLTQDDLFPDGDSNPDGMNCDETRKMEITEEIRDPKKVLPKHEGLENESYGSQRKVIRKEYATETFLDVDGFMVTKRVLKEIELGPSSANTSTKTHGKTMNARRLDSKERRSAKVSQGQAKISSYFQRK